MVSITCILKKVHKYKTEYKGTVVTYLQIAVQNMTIIHREVKN